MVGANAIFVHLPAFLMWQLGESDGRALSAATVQVEQQVQAILSATALRNGVHNKNTDAHGIHRYPSAKKT
jgi:hypothetical protein